MTGSEMNRPNSETEEQLRQALHAKAESVHPSPHALDEIQARLDGVVVANATVTQLHQPRPIIRYVSMAAALLVAVGGFAYLSQRRTVTNLDVAIDTTTSIQPETPTTTESVIEPTTTQPAPATSELLVSSNVSVPTGPVAATQIEAAQKFLKVLGMNGPAEFSDADGVVSVRRPDSETEIVRLQTASVSGGGWVITSATSDGITAELGDFDPAGVSSLVVSGEGRGFEASLDVVLVSALDGSLISGTYAKGGMPDPKPYSAEIPVIGSELAWVVVQSDGGASDEEAGLQEFAAVPVAYQALPDSRTFGVFRIATSDSDNGLNLRSSPGTDENSVLATLPAGTPGIRRTASMPVLVGDAVWREVETADGQTGWAHTNFLTSMEPITDQELLYIGNQLAEASNQDSHWMFPFLPWSERVQVAFAWTGDLDNKDYRLDYADLKAGGVWGPDAYKDWAVPEATFDKSIINATHRDFLNLPQGAELEVTVGTGSYAYEFEQTQINSFAPNLRSVVVTNLNSDGPWSAVHLFVEPTPAGPQIVAIAVSHMVP